MYKVKVVSKLDGRSRPALVSYQNGKPIGDLVALDDPSVFSTTSNHAHSSESNEGKPENKWVRSKDGSLVPLPSGAVQYPGLILINLIKCGRPSQIRSLREDCEFLNVTNNSEFIL